MLHEGREPLSPNAASATDVAREQLLTRALGELRRGGAGALDVFVRGLPEESWLRRQVDFLRQLGLLDDGPNEHGWPRRLGDFELLRRIGGGGMGMVFAARQHSLDREVAVKIVRPELVGFDQARARFRREIDAVARLQHPAIVRIHAAGEEHGMPFLAMELLEGATLQERLDRICAPAALRVGADLHPRWRGTWPAACAELVAEVAEAMQHAHDRGVRHRDLKPSNILLTDTGRPVVIDFGLAIGEGDLRITMSQVHIGSLPYCPPECLAGDDDVDDDRRGDVYSLGTVLYELLAGRAAFEGGSPNTLRRRIERGECAPLRQDNAGVPRDLAVVVQTAMAERRHRYGTMGDFAADLRAVFAGLPIAARAPGPLRRTALWIRRHPTAAVLAVLVAVLSIGTPTALWASERARRAEGAPLLAAATADRLLQAEGEMWPTSPALLQSRSGYDDWLLAADVLLRERSGLVVMRDDLRSRAVYCEDGAPGHEVVVQRRRAELAVEIETEQWVQRHMVYGKEARLQPIRLRVAALREELHEEHPYGFTDPNDERRHSVLVRLLAKLAQIEALVPSVRERREHAVAIAAASAAAEGAWATAAAAIARDPRYGGLRLRPQAGLVPLGCDPSSGLLEFAHLPSGEPAVRSANTGRLELTDRTGVVFVLLPGGAFWMGAAPDDPIQPDLAAAANEQPVHRVELAPFFLAKYELTQGQWLRVNPCNPSMIVPPAGDGENPRPATLLHPVETIAWTDAEASLRRLGLALPTEAQWEYAARAGSHGVHGDVDPAHASTSANLVDLDAWGLTAPVGTFGANGFGLHDIFGNVAEWCLDGGEIYTVPPQHGDGRRFCRPDCPRITRGGAYSGGLQRVAERVPQPIGTALAQLGVRAARAIDE